MEIMGLPLHPLVVHAVVVLVPLSALGGLAISIFGWARKRYGSLVVVGSFAAAVSTLVAQQAGEALYASMPQHSAAVERHASIGGGLLLWAILLFAGCLAVFLAQVMIDRGQPHGRLAVIIGGAVTVVSAVVSLVQVIRIGHAGSTAAWG